jgi:hypothetical protein
MYCPACGNSVKKGLKYCNNCGAQLFRSDEDKDGTPGKMLDNILTTLFLTVMFGFGILVGLVAVLLGNGVPNQLVAMIVIAYLAAIFGVCFMLVKQVPKLIDAKLKSFGPSSAEPSAPQLQPLITGQLDEYRQPVMSVTDHTTRTLDKVPLKDDRS